jgi:hypothetical protein
VDHDIVTLRIIRIAEDGQRRIRRLDRRIADVDREVGAFFEAGLEDDLLGRVVVAAAAEDEQGLERPGGFRGDAATEEYGDGENNQSESTLGGWEGGWVKTDPPRKATVK